MIKLLRIVFDIAWTLLQMPFAIIALISGLILILMSSGSEGLKSTLADIYSEVKREMENRCL